uniref:type II toxin-antitoxin system Phd/YefM family antitoxin n=1 Tax=Candidatus Fimivicinus sp. TaxID=3056640 RepID=UPI003FF091F6
MTNTNITNLRKNLFEYIDQAITYNDVINVNTKKGNAVIMSEEEYNGLMETLHILAVPGLTESIVESAKEPLDSMANADDLEW